ncbi:hypothetical protein [Cohaesibacter marisflavi]|uniref:hypothetical protein n=1 Tax=Cohaesibacter marisflavi TaxID=655353 RepID=UPI0029C6017A|nr:hypothetical protein [Cohaesibacter marisflavi]
MKKIIFGIITAILASFASGLAIDTATELFGKIGRGVSYGVSILYLWAAVSTILAILMTLSHFMGRNRSMILGVTATVLVTFFLFPNPSLVSKLFITAILSLIVVFSVCIQSLIE